MNPVLSKEKAPKLLEEDSVNLNSEDESSTSNISSCTKECNGERSSEEEEDIPEGEYEVEKVVDYVKNSKEELYFIKWKGWAEEHNTWEPPSSLESCKKAKTDFYLKRKAEIEDITSQREYVILENGQKRKRGPPLKIQLPPDPRPLAVRAEIFYEATRFPTALEIKNNEERWKKDFQMRQNDDGKSHSKKLIRWVRNKLENSLEGLLNMSEEAETEFRFQLYIGQLDEKRGIATRELKIWEAELNKITEKKPLIKVQNDEDWEGPPQNFTYINDYKPAADVVIPDEPLIWCKCENCSSKETDCCVNLNESVFAYTPHKKVRVAPGTPIYECNRMCKCGPECANRVVQDGRESLISLRLCIFRTSNKGWGVKTLKNIKKGTFVSLYIGEIIRTDEADRRYIEYDTWNGCTYLFDLDVNEGEADCPYTVDAAKYGNITHFINHSCDPNLAVFNVFVNCINPDLPKLALFTTRDIRHGEELTFNYKNNCNPSEEECGRKTTPCLCGAPKCKKFLFF